ncbi:hypothetical protein HOC35_03520 [Candidatus Woesearchaeota archaeon]|jgi:hypothetical protein|nr:hypothetical protein [Candidatus Woesearchaeota archaeon]
MAFKHLFWLESEDLSDSQILQRIALARDRNNDKFEFKTKDGSKVKVHINREYKHYEDIECGILD